MIYCVCRQLNTAKIDEAISSGARSASGVMAHHGTSFNCGTCKSSIEERLAATTIPACIANAAQMDEAANMRSSSTASPSTGTVLFAAQ